MEEHHLTNFYKILKAILEMEYDRLLKYYLGDKLHKSFDEENIVPSTDFSHPLKIVLTLLSLFAIYSFSVFFSYHIRTRSGSQPKIYTKYCRMNNSTPTYSPS